MGSTIELTSRIRSAHVLARANLNAASPMRARRPRSLIGLSTARARATGRSGAVEDRDLDRDVVGNQVPHPLVRQTDHR